MAGRCRRRVAVLVGLLAVLLVGVGVVPAGAAPTAASASCGSRALPGPMAGKPTPRSVGNPVRPARVIRGDYTTRWAGEFISGVAIDGTLTIAHDNVTVKCVSVRGVNGGNDVSPGIPPAVLVKGRGARIALTSIGVVGEYGGPAGVRNEADATLRRVEIRGTTDGVRQLGQTLDMRDSVVYALSYRGVKVPGQDGVGHNDGIQITRGQGIRLVNNWFDADMRRLGGAKASARQTANIGVYTGADVSGVISGNVLAGNASSLINGSGAGADGFTGSGNLVDAPLKTDMKVGARTVRVPDLPVS